MEAYLQLEKEWAEFNHLDPEGMVACSSGTAALHLALESFQLPPGSEVLVPDYTMIACARSVSLAGLTPVLVDCDHRCLISNRSCADALLQSGEKIEAVMPVHIYGRLNDMHSITDISFGTLKILEDMSEAHGVYPYPSTDAACWSFYCNKIVCCTDGEGGAVWFLNPEHARLARSLRCLGFTPDHDFRHLPRGHNYRLSNVHAELILESLRRYPENLEERRRIEGWYNNYCPAKFRMPRRDAPWVYDLRIPGMKKVTQDKLVQQLRENGIEARHGFKPMSLQEEYQNCRLVGNRLAHQIYPEIIYLPIQPGQTTEADASRSFTIIKTVL